jgi:PAS domain S-box-containing protein
MRGPAPEGRLSTANGLRVLIAAYFAVLLIIAAVTIPTLVDTLNTLNREQQVYDTASAAVSELLVGALNQETGVRGYALAGLSSFLQPLELGETQYGQSLAVLQGTDLGPTFSRDLTSTARAFEDWKVLADQVVTEVRRGDIAAARAHAEQTEAKNRFDAFRKAQNALSMTVRNQVRSDRHSLHQKVVLSLIIICAALAFGALIGIGMLIWWSIWGRSNATREREMTDHAVLLQSAIDASSDSIFAKDTEGRHILSNRARAAALTQGNGDTVLVGRKVDEFVDPALSHEIRRHELEVMRSGSSRTFEETLPQPDGMHFYSVTKNPLRDATGSVIGIVGVERDITRERALLLDRERLYHLEHELALTLQISMLSNVTVDDERIATCTRYIPAEDRLSVGGDWYDLFPLEGGRVGLTVGDAVGHGVQSVTSMGGLRSALTALVGLGFEPGRTLDGLDRFADQSLVSRYATCLYAVLDLSAGELSYSSAGQTPAVLVSRDGEVTLLNRIQDPPLAVPNPGRRTCTVPFVMGSTILAYTDGLIERREEEIDTSLARMVTTVRRLANETVDDLCDGLLDELVRSRSHRDDVAMVAVRFVKDATP